MNIYNMLKRIVLCLVLLTSLVSADNIHINQVGYNTNGPKFAVSEQAWSSFQIVDASTDLEVYDGELSEEAIVSDWFEGASYYKIDFSDFTTPGTYKIKIGGFRSDSFKIGDEELFSQTFDDALSFFKNSRADDADVWSKDAAVSFYGVSGMGTRDVRGGWYDASGDISKYLSHLNYGNYTMPQQISMSAYLMADITERFSTKLSNYNLFSGLQDEAIWGADYLIRILDQDGYFYINIFDGWSGYVYDRQICAFEGSNGDKTNEFQAGFREGAGLAIASLARMSQWTISGDSSSAAYLAGAIKAWDHLTANDFEKAKAYADDGVLNFLDSYTILIAAVELYNATSDAKYLTEARNQVALMQNTYMHSSGYFMANTSGRPFYHAADAGFPVVALSRYMEVEGDMSSSNIAKSLITKNLNYQLTVTADSPNPFGYGRQHIYTSNAVKSSFFIAHDNETDYWWQGESARLGSLASAAILGGSKISDEPSTLKVSQELYAYAMDQLDWIMGKNPYDVCFMSGFGKNNPPSYGSGTSPYHGHLDGGISNGITGGQYNSDGSGIEWNPSFGSDDSWMNWRWVEQWIPHAHWYMMATALSSDAHIESSILVSTLVNPKQLPRQINNSFDVWTDAGKVKLTFAKPLQKTTAYNLINANGQVLNSGLIAAGTLKLDIEVSNFGVYYFNVKNIGLKTIVIQ